ncbi:uncharacterized protein LOC6574428 [Drosophila mojavensis]|uniref:DUF4780 domain-containing protein n=1 Tax=Drosophila mojavensis TaxID=7230 RepID=B4KDC7_DROMO|nr:uncharacterized protein LOC6574428 [Drosophila mojavensis]EDW15936.2 uncharacterized protein Dmoj_GI10250 [Drosophila mojavensis]
MNSNQQNPKREFGPPNQRPRNTTGFARGGRGAGLIKGNRPKNVKQIQPQSGTFGETPTPLVSRRPAHFFRPDPAKATKLDKAKATRILKRNAYAPITEDQASSRQDYFKIQEDIAWARAVLPNFEVGSVSPNQPVDAEPILETLIVEVRNKATTREHGELGRTDVASAGHVSPYHSDDSSAAKRTRSSESPLRSFAAMARGRQIIGVIDSSQPDGKIPRNQWCWIQAAMAAVALEVLRDDPGPPPSCMDIGWFQGTTKLIACDNERSVLLYRAAIAKIGEVYPGAQLEVIDVQDIPSRPWATAWLPETPSESNDILELLTRFNPNLPTNDWKVIKAIRFREAAMEVIFQINQEAILYLTRCDGLLSYGFNKIHMKYYATPYEALSDLEAFAAAVDPPSDDEKEATDGALSEELSSESECEGSRHSLQ